MKNEKRKGGRPKEKVEEKVDFGIVQRYAALGFTTNEELAYLLDVSVRTIIRYKADEKFLSLLQGSIFKADQEVVESLKLNATGYERIVEKPMVVSDGKDNGSHVEIVKYKQYFPPETMACNSWLNNRRKHQFAWSPKPTTGLEDSQTEQLRKLATGAMDEAL